MDQVRRWLASRFLISDVKKTIAAIDALPIPYRSSIAKNLDKEIQTAVSHLSAARKQGLDVEHQVWAELMANATARRQASVRLGASSRTNPQWAISALSEAWLTAASNRLGSKANEIQKLIDLFIRRQPSG